MFPKWFDEWNKSNPTDVFKPAILLGTIAGTQLITRAAGSLVPVGAVLLGVADSLQELKAVCHCGRKATMNLRMSDTGEAVGEGAQTEIGGNERYVALCRRHFAKQLAMYR